MSTTKFSERRVLTAAHEWGELEALRYLHLYVMRHDTLPPAPGWRRWKIWRQSFEAAFDDSYPDAAWLKDFAWRKYQEGWLYAYNYIKDVVANKGAQSPPDTNLPEYYEMIATAILSILANRDA